MFIYNPDDKPVTLITYVHHSDTEQYTFSGFLFLSFSPPPSPLQQDVKIIGMYFVYNEA
jgi:hypothetical protein